VRRAWPLVVLLLGGCATFQALFQEDRPFFVPAGAAHISGAYSRAIGIAYDDLMADRAREKAERDASFDGGDSGEPDTRPLNECFDRPDAYQTWVNPGDAGASYVVTILTLDGYCLPRIEGWLYNGGGVIYEIDAKTFRILKKEIQE
jgi:hypothetical protein